MRITDARILGGGPPRSRRTSHPSPAPTHPDRLGFTKPLTSTLVVNHGFALTHTFVSLTFMHSGKTTSRHCRSTALPCSWTEIQPRHTSAPEKSCSPKRIL